MPHARILYVIPLLLFSVSSSVSTQGNVPSPGTSTTADTSTCPYRFISWNVHEMG
ncbi:MAG: hypothetical protein RLZZ480_932, partial [Candidatus Parcubacteria bacterium]